MSCPSYTTGNQTEFATEINLHLSGLKNVTKPAVLLFPSLLVCLDCGFSRFTIPEAKLALLTKAAATSGAD
jgi:hypothetical protein